MNQHPVISQWTADPEFSALPEGVKSQKISNFFEHELVDEEFRSLDDDEQSARRDRFVGIHLGGFNSPKSAGADRGYAPKLESTPGEKLQSAVDNYNRQNHTNKTVEDIPDRSGVVGSVLELGHGIVNAARDQFPEDVARIYQGSDVKLNDHSYAQKVIDEQEQDRKSRLPSKQVILGDGWNESLAQGPASIVTSAVVGSSGAFAGAAGGSLVAPGPGTVAGAMIGAASSSGPAFYRLAKNQFLGEMLDLAKAKNVNLTNESWESIKADIDDEATKIGLWEAGPEAISQFFTAGLVKGAGGKIFGKIPGLSKITGAISKRAAARIGAKITAELAEEEVTEYATYEGQENIRKGMGLRKTDPTLSEFIDTQAGPVAVGSVLQLGAHKAGSKTYDLLKGDSFSSGDSSDEKTDLEKSLTEDFEDSNSPESKAAPAKDDPYSEAEINRGYEEDLRAARESTASPFDVASDAFSMEDPAPSSSGVPKAKPEAQPLNDRGYTEQEIHARYAEELRKVREKNATPFAETVDLLGMGEPEFKSQSSQGLPNAKAQSLNDEGYTEKEILARYAGELRRVREENATPFESPSELMGMEDPTVKPNMGQFQGGLPAARTMEALPPGANIISQQGEQTAYDSIPMDDGSQRNDLPVPYDAKNLNLPAPSVSMGREVKDQPVIDIQAHEAATSPLNSLAEPTQAQKEAGNYKKAHVRALGMDIAIENPVGSERSGTDESGEAWSITMQHHYGYLKGTVGKDKDHLDIFLKDGAEASDIEAKPVYVVDQVNDDGSFDEHKILAGFDNEQEAQDGYLSNYDEGWQGIGAITEMTPANFKKWANSGKTTKPISYKRPPLAIPEGVNVRKNGKPYAEKGIRLAVANKVKKGINAEAVQLDKAGKKWGWKEVVASSVEPSQETKTTLPNEKTELVQKKAESKPKTPEPTPVELVSDPYKLPEAEKEVVDIPVYVKVMKDGKPYGKRGIDLVVKNKAEEGIDVEAVQMDKDGKEWGWRETSKPLVQEYFSSAINPEVEEDSERSSQELIRVLGEALERGSQFEFEDDFSVINVKTGEKIIKLARAPRNANDIISPLGEELRNALRREGREMSRNPEDMSLHEFRIAHRAGLIPSFEFNGGELNDLFHTESGLFEFNADGLYAKIQREKKKPLDASSKPRKSEKEVVAKIATTESKPVQSLSDSNKLEKTEKARNDHEKSLESRIGCLEAKVEKVEKVAPKSEPVVKADPEVATVIPETKQDQASTQVTKNNVHPKDVNLTKSGVPFKKKGIDFAVANLLRKGVNAEPVQLDKAGKEWGWREIEDDGPAMDADAQKVIREKLTKAVPSLEYEALMEHADTLIDNEGFTTDDVYEVISQIEEENEAKKESPVRFSKSKGKPSSSSATLPEIKAAISKLETVAVNAKESIVVQSVEGLPRHITNALKSQGGGIIEAAYDGQAIYFVADNIHSLGRSVELWMHEQGIHNGLRGLMDGKKLNSTLDNIHRSVSKTAHYKKIVADYGLDMDKLSDRRIAAEEYLANLGEKIRANKILNPREKAMWRKVVEAVMSWLRSKGFKNDLLTKQEISGIAADAVAWTVHGESVASKTEAQDSLSKAKAETRFSIDKMDARKVIDSLDDPKVRNFLNTKDIGWLQEVAALPHWISKKFPEFQKVYERQLTRMDERSVMFSDSLQETEDFFSGISDSELKEVETLIWSLDGKNIKDVKSKKFVSVMDDKGRPVRENGRLVLESNPEHYAEYEKWLSKKPLSKKAREAFLSVRKSLDNDFLRAYDAMRQMSEISDNEIDEFRKQINHVQNYFPHHRYGDYFVAVYGKGKDGKEECIYREHFDAPTKFHAGKIGGAKIKELKKKYPNALHWDKGENTKLPDEVYGVPIDTNALEQIVHSAASSIADPDQAGDIKLKLSAAVSDVLKSRGWGSHSIGRKGVPGHEKTDVRKVLYDYKSGLTGWLTKMEASRDMTKAVGKINARKNPKLYKYALTYVENMLRNSDHIDRAAGNVKALAFVWYLGGNVKTAALNLTQNIITGAPRLGMETSMSGMRVFKAAGNSLVSAATEGKNLSKDEQQLLDDMYKEGVITEAFLDEIRGEVVGMSGARYWNKTIKWLGMPMAIAERFNRATLALAAYQVARDGHITRDKTLKSLGLKKGEKASYEVAKQFSEGIVRDAHFVYGKANQPQPLRDSSIGRGLSPIYTFRTFSHNLISLWGWMLREEGAAGAAAFGKSLGATAMLGGLTALPFYYSLLAITQAITGDDDDWTEEIRKSMPEGDMMRDVVCYGLPAMAGVSMGGSLSLELPLAGNIEPGSTPESVVGGNMGELFGIPYDMLLKKPSDFLKHHRAGNNMRAIESISPTVIKNMMSSYRLYNEGQTSASGKPINEPGKSGARKLTKKEALLKAIGFQPVSNTKNWDEYRARTASRGARSVKLMGISNRLARAVKNNDHESMLEIFEEVAKWNNKAIQRKKYWLYIKPDDVRRGVISRMKNKGVGKREAYRIMEQQKG